ncbi:hypothetical protein SDRG_10874 [Saprolegnia diclina VS20]|uniref:DUSP domain-containing protein n=1 Tax=Saprolegnia diclina (strain VS20) TaxID=1156394 RepID=T0Q090_SAPDV|nr:hypothetical protein SDRG_10874 [Saprolegnia diclina VS20]EQC31269.1 hypothetical protein SDRG_10874 [Saprolegnia diclina VS20]|eukprot:XP_008615110.1 hypothetical protein SDRG_10874 [Saprolegnia diclina VS20]
MDPTEHDTLALLRPFAASADDVVEVHVPAGPLAIVMDRTNDQNAVIESFAKLPSGLAGAIEMHGGIPPGSVLVAINQKDVSGLNTKQVSDILREQKDKSKVLGWRVNKPLSPIKPLSPRKPVAAPPTPVSVATPPVADRRASNGTEFVTENIVVLVPSGPLGLLLDGQLKHRAVVQGFQKLPDGSPGVLELHDNIHPGASLVAINGEDVSAWPLDAVTRRLGELASTERILEFALPRRRANSQDFDLRRKEEFTFLKKHDKTKIARGECWLVIDAKWIERWVLYAAMNGPPPGPITNETLVMDGWQERLSGAVAGDPDRPRANLKVGVDYRCVTPLVWCFFVALHGTSKLPPLARYKMDVYANPISALEANKILKPMSLKAETTVTEIKQRCHIE